MTKQVAVRRQQLRRGGGGAAGGLRAAAVAAWGEEGGKRRLRLRRSNGRDVLHECQTLKGGEEKILWKMYKISGTAGPGRLDSFSAVQMKDMSHAKVFHPI